jgi:hypothetical protein
MKKGAGMTFAPPSNGSGGAHNAYIVDRGVDNFNQSSFNDGRMYEIAIPAPSSGGGTVDVPIRVVPTTRKGSFHRGPSA